MTNLATRVARFRAAHPPRTVALGGGHCGHFFDVGVGMETVLLLPGLTPLHVLLALALPGNRITWRGQRLRLHPNGKMEVGSQ